MSEYLDKAQRNACRIYYEAVKSHERRFCSRTFPYRNTQPLVYFTQDLCRILTSIWEGEGEDPALASGLSLLLVEAVASIYSVLDQVPDYDEAMWLQQTFANSVPNYPVLLIPIWGRDNYWYHDLIGQLLLTWDECITQAISSENSEGINEATLKSVPSSQGGAGPKLCDRRQMIIASITSAVEQDMGLLNARQQLDYVRNNKMSSNKRAIVALYLLISRYHALAIIAFPRECSEDVFNHDVIFHEIGHYVFERYVEASSPVNLRDEWMRIREEALLEAVEKLAKPLAKIVPILFPDLKDTEAVQSVTRALQEQISADIKVSLSSYLLEMFCDAFAFYLAGPPYLLALLHFLLGRNPVQLLDSFSDTHPPAILRLFALSNMMATNTGGIWKDVCLGYIEELNGEKTRLENEQLSELTRPEDFIRFGLFYGTLKGATEMQGLLKQVLDISGVPTFSELDRAHYQRLIEILDRRELITPSDFDVTTRYYPAQIFGLAWLYYSLKLVSSPNSLGLVRSNLNRLLIRSIETLTRK